MKLSFMLCSFFISVFIFMQCGGDQSHSNDRATLVQKQFVANLDSVDQHLKDLKKAAEEWEQGDVAASDRFKKYFKRSRIAYKNVEFLLTYHYPSVAKQINGPALDKIEEDDPNQVVVPPEGFQVIEEYLFPEASFAQKPELINEIEILRTNLNRVQKYENATRFTDKHILDAMRMDLLRVMSLGISGFDSPVALHSIPEAQASLLALESTFQVYENDIKQMEPELARHLADHFKAAISYLNRSADFNSFDRLHFIKKYGIPISEQIFESQKALGIPFPDYQRPWKPEVATVFSKDAFDPYAFAPVYVDEPNSERIELGRTLFYDPVLSAAGERSCGTCHQPDKAFTDGLTRSKTLNPDDKKLRNAPTLINAALQNATFYDLRTHFLEDQITDVVTNTSEMHGSFDKAVEDLSKSQAYIEQFSKAFPGDKAFVSEENIRVALASYLRTLEGLNSRFDQYLRGNKKALTSVEKKGFNLFMGKAKCGTCHFMPLFNGTVPPAFTDTEAEVLGVPAEPDTANATINPDVGKFVLYGSPLDRFAFKTPTVRNAELTAPYMHNGVYKTLEEVVDFYNRGGGYGIGIKLPNQTLPTDTLNLSIEEQKALVAFMEALTDTAGLTQIPEMLPAIAENKESAGREADTGY